jgi:WD40 repeat protein
LVKFEIIYYNYIIINLNVILLLTLKATFTDHNGTVSSLAVLQNGDLASGSADQTIKIWDSLTGTLKKTLTGHSDWVRSLAVLQNGDLASGSSDKTVKIWDFQHNH